MVMPKAAMSTSAAKTESGIEIATMKAARQSPRKATSTSMASARPRTRDWTTFMMFS